MDTGLRPSTVAWQTLIIEMGTRWGESVGDYKVGHEYEHYVTRSILGIIIISSNKNMENQSSGMMMPPSLTDLWESHAKQLIGCMPQ